MNRGQEEAMMKVITALLRRHGGELVVFPAEWSDYEEAVVLFTENADGSLGMALVPDYVKHALNTPPEPIEVQMDGKPIGTVQSVDWTPAGLSVQARVTDDFSSRAIREGWFDVVIQPYQQKLADDVFKYLEGTPPDALKPKKKKKDRA